MSCRLALLALAAVLGLLAGAGIAVAAWSSSGPGTASLGTTTASATARTCGGLADVVEVRRRRRLLVGRGSGCVLILSTW